MRRDVEVFTEGGQTLVKLTVHRDDGTVISNAPIFVTRQLALNQMAQAAEREEQLRAEMEQQRTEYDLWKDVLSQIE